MSSSQKRNTLFRTPDSSACYANSTHVRIATHVRVRGVSRQTSMPEIDVHVRTSSDRIATRHDVRVRVFAYIVWPMTRPESKVVV